MSDSRSPISAQTQTNEGQSGIAVLVRLFWMFLGNLLLIILSFKIAQSEGISIADIALWSVAVAIVVLRYIDIKYLNGQTANSQRATLSDWRRHLLLVAGAATVLWVFGHTLFKQVLG